MKIKRKFLVCSIGIVIPVLLLSPNLKAAKYNELDVSEKIVLEDFDFKTKIGEEIFSIKKLDENRKKEYQSILLRIKNKELKIARQEI